MNFLGVFMAPDLVEESWREIERKREHRRTMREGRAARLSRFAPFAARVHRALHPAPVPLPQGC